MNRHIISLVVAIGFQSFMALANTEKSYGYDNINSEIYAKTDNYRKSIKFKEDDTGNHAYMFDFFSGNPAIIAVSQSLHDSTTYATLSIINDKFYIDCLYYDVKSKQNGLLVKEGVCGLKKNSPEKYSDYIDEKINNVELEMDAIDTTSILNGKANYLPIVIYRSKEKTLYKVYYNKQSFLDDHYSVLSTNYNGECKVYGNKPWVIYNSHNPMQADIKSEKIISGKIKLFNATPDISKSNECLLYPTISINSEKAFFYDDNLNIKKTHLIHGDKINLLSTSTDGKWCDIRYFNEKNKTLDGHVLCADLNLEKGNKKLD